MGNAYVAPGYWVSGYAEGDEWLKYTVWQTEYLLNQYENALLFPLVAYSNNPIVYSVFPDLPKGLRLDSVTGAIYGAPEYLAPQNSYTIAAIDTENISASATFTIAVRKDAAPSIQAIDNVAIALGRIALQYRWQA